MNEDIAVEPDSHMLDEFQQSVEAKKAKGGYETTTFHFIPKTLEDYEHTYGKVDLILMVQSLYCIFPSNSCATML